jgi:hypothetical protein
MIENSEESASDLILECIDQSLSCHIPELLSLVYDLAEKSFGISKEEIPQNPDAFEEALEGAFGTSSAEIEAEMKKLIVETFHLREDLNFHALPELISEIMISTNAIEESMMDGT